MYLGRLSEETGERFIQDREKDVDYILRIAGCLEEFRR